mmetsp:Transcript_35941/g.65992  ORF Transcript_35941/g.65992 Transcript_35941/m.65992 type:complete len:442 (-) Transcript_35941:82-1407(-)
MSFRELRNFCEVMRALGYHRLISMENFRTPNFELVADILDWLLHRFEPGCSVPDDISTESHRVDFIKVVCEKVVLRTNIKLNARKLYGADGYAVKECLKLAQMLYDAQRSVVDLPPRDPMDDNNFSLNSKLADLKSTRTLCSQIVEHGAGLFESLQKEMDIRGDREKALRFLDGISRNLDSNSEHELVERAVSQMLSSHGSNLEQLQQMTKELQQDERTLEQKIKKKEQELDRCRKRLSSLVNVRPAFMDEYEKLEQELERYYEQYVGRFRNLDYLEHELDCLNREEKERMEENERALKKMRDRLREAEWRILRGDGEDMKDEKDRRPNKPQGKQRRESRAKGGNAGAGGPKSEVYGGMHAADGEDVSSEGSGSDSDLPISVAGGSHESDEPPVSLGGGSASDEDIVDESEEEDNESDDDIIGGSSRMPHGRGGLNDNHNF